MNGPGYHVNPYLRQQNAPHSQSPAQHDVQPNTLQLTEQAASQSDKPPSSERSKLPYGSGDSEDGYTLVFENMDAFNAWRIAEEEAKCIEFVKGDTHHSKAAPPRFKEHTKLVCARHSRSGRKKYVKKHPERQRKVPSRKIEGDGCPASISFKTYFGTEEIRASYSPVHSHEIGEANLPFTRKGRKALAAKDPKKRQRSEVSVGQDPTNDETADDASGSGSTSGIHPLVTDDQMMNDADESQESQINPTSPPEVHNGSLNMHGSNSNGAIHYHQGNGPGPPVRPSQQPHSHSHSHTHSHQLHASPASLHHHPPPPHAPPSHLPLNHAPPSHPPPQQVTLPVLGTAPEQERWDRMAVLFESVRNHARTMEFSPPSVVALESVLIRLYLESPLHGMPPPGPGSGSGMGNGNSGLGLNMAPSGTHENGGHH